MKSNAAPHVAMSTRTGSTNVLAEAYKQSGVQDLEALQLEFGDSHCLVIDPLGLPRLAWDLAGLALIIFEVMMVPMELAFFNDADFSDAGNFWWWSELLVNVFFLVDFCLNCITGFVRDDGIQVRKQALILKNYLLKPPYYMVIDVVSLLPLAFFIVSQTSNERSSLGLTRAVKTGRFLRYARFVRVLRLLRIAKAVRVVRRLATMLVFSGRLATTGLQILQLILAIFMMVHLMACLWRGVSNFSAHAQGAGTDPQNAYESYSLAVWWTVSTLTDGPPVEPTSAGEMWFNASMSLFCYLFGCIQLAFLVQIFDNFQEDRRQVSLKLNIANRFIVSHQLPPHVNGRIVNAVNSCHRYDRYLGDFKTHIEPLLSEDLRMEIFGHVHGHLIKRFPPFSDRDEDAGVMRKFQFRLALSADIRHYSAKDFIFEESKRADTMIFFINGSARLTSIQQNITFPKVDEGWWLGDKVLFWDAQKFGSMEQFPARSATCRAVTPCTTLEIHVESFREAVKEFHLEKWLARMVAKGAEGISWGCPLCGQEGHFVPECLLAQTKSADKEKSFVQ